MVSPNVKDLDKHQLDPYLKKQNAKLIQVVQNFFIKAVQIILDARSEELDYDNSDQRTNKWFNLLMPSLNKDELKTWKSTSFPPMIIETSISLHNLSEKHTLVSKDGDGNSWAVVKGGGKKQEVVIERWLIEFDSTDVSGSIIDELPLIYKQAIILFRSLFGILRLLPAYKLKQKLKKMQNLVLCNKILDGKQPISSKGRIGLSKPIIPTQSLRSESHLVQKNFNPIQTTLGTLKVSGVYRRHFDFVIHDSEEALSDHFMKMDSGSIHKHLAQTNDSELEASRPSFEEPNVSTVSRQSSLEPTSVVRDMDAYRKSMSISPNTVRESSPMKKDAQHLIGRPAIQPFKVGSIGSSPPPQSYSSLGASSLERKVSITSNKSASNASLVAMLRNPKGSVSSTTGNIPISNSNANNSTIISSIPRSVASSHGSNLMHDLDSPSAVEMGAGTPRFSSSFGSRASRRYSNASIRQSILQQNLNDHSYLGTSAGLATSMNPLSGIYIDDDISDFVRMIDSKNDLRFNGSTGYNSSERVNLTPNSQVDILSKFQLLKSQHQQLGDSVNQSLILQNNGSNPGSINNPVQISTSRKSSTHSQSMYSPISPGSYDRRSGSSNMPTIESQLDYKKERADKQVGFDFKNSRQSTPTAKQDKSPAPSAPQTNNPTDKRAKAVSTTPSHYSNRRSIQYENVFEDDDGEDYYLQSKSNHKPSNEEDDDDLLFTMSDMNLTKH